MQVKKQQLELDMEQWTGSKLGKEYVKAAYHYPAYLYMPRTSCEMPGWIKPGIKIARRNIINFIYADDTTLIAESKEKLKNHLMSVKQGSE